MDAKILVKLYQQKNKQYSEMLSHRQCVKRHFYTISDLLIPKKSKYRHIPQHKIISDKISVT